MKKGKVVSAFIRHILKASLLSHIKMSKRNATSRYRIFRKPFRLKVIIKLLEVCTHLVCLYFRPPHEMVTPPNSVTHFTGISPLLRCFIHVNIMSAHIILIVQPERRIIRVNEPTQPQKIHGDFN